jgi:hypothetical protein
MERDGRCTAVSVAILTVRAALANLGEAQAFQDPSDLAGLEDRNVSHAMRP